jgi:hypothetical protein
MSQHSLRRAKQVGLLLGSVVLAGLGLIDALGVVSGSGNFLSRFVGAVRALVILGIAWGLFKASRRFGDLRQRLPDNSALGDLRRVYVEGGLDRATQGEGNPYSDLSDRELLDVWLNIGPQAPAERMEALRFAIKGRIESCYLPDGRKIPEALRLLSPHPAPPESHCAKHSDRPAVVTCLRCGAFACEGCSALNKKHCADCLDRLVESR